MTTLPYLPQELWDLINDIKYDLECRDKRIELTKDLRQLRKTYDSIINFDSIKLIKDNIREINKNVDKRIKLSQNKYDLAMELINLDAKDMGWTTVKYDEGLALMKLKVCLVLRLLIQLFADKLVRPFSFYNSSID